MHVDDWFLAAVFANLLFISQLQEGEYSPTDQSEKDICKFCLAPSFVVCDISVF